MLVHKAYPNPSRGGEFGMRALKYKFPSKLILELKNLHSKKNQVLER